MINPPILSNPQLIDAALLPLQEKFKDCLSWLDNAYGRCERIPTDKAYRRFIPVVYAGNGANKATERDYIELFPSDTLGNFCFFTTQRANIDQLYTQPNVYFYDVGLIFWFDYRKVFGDDHLSNRTANVITQVLELLDNSTKIQLDNVEEEVPQIYSEFAYGSINSLFRERPYGCFRINFQLKYQDLSCQQ